MIGALSLALAVAAASAGALVPAPVPATERFVIAIGYNAADPDPRPTLQFADDDAARFFRLQLGAAHKAWLLTTFDRASARTYPELADIARAPSKLELMRVMGEIEWQVREAKKRGAATELIFYFAGHGSVDAAGEGYLVLADGTLTRGELQEHVVRGSPADVNHVIIDACASYFMVARDDAVAAPVALAPATLDVLRNDGDVDVAAWARTGILVSTSSSAAVHETPALGSGIFSYLLRSALAGAADVDGDGVIEYAEASGFVAAASAGVPDARARLDVFARSPAQRPNAALFDLRSSGATYFLDVPADAPSRVRVLDAWGTPYAELSREPGAAARIALVGNPFYIVQVGDKEAQLAPRSPGAYALSSLDFSGAPKERGTATGLPARFMTRPFGNAYLGGFLTSSELAPPLSRSPYVVAFAEAGAPPAAPPYRAAAVGTWIGAGVAAGVATAGVIGNLATFATIDDEVRRTGVIDPSAGLQLEAWRATAVAGAVGSVILLGAGGALWLVADSAEAEAPWR